MIVKVKAFINVSNSSGYKLESLRNNDIEITINFVKIEVSLDNDTITYNSNNYYVLRASQGIPSVLLEIDYITGPDSSKLLDLNYQNQFISATFSSIEEYFKK